MKNSENNKLLTGNTMVLSINLIIHRRRELVLCDIGLRNDTTIMLVERTLCLSGVVIDRTTFEIQTAVVVSPAKIQTFL